MLLNYRKSDNCGVAVASPSKRERPSVKIAHIRLRISVFEEFAIEYNLTTHILIRYGQKYIAQWEINTKHKRAKNYLHDTHSLKRADVSCSNDAWLP